MTVINRTLNLTNDNGSAVYPLRFPQNIITFITYSFTPFMEKAVDLCQYAMRERVYPEEEITALRNSVSGCHTYFEKNIRTVFDKFVIDCWIDFICKQNETGPVTLWNGLIHCRDPFEKALFSRISEYRAAKAVNQWTNMLRIQDYAARKVEFVFGQKLSDVTEASSRADYFDLLFNVAANEIGYDTRQMPGVRMYTTGRLPNSQFVMSRASREIARNLLTDVNHKVTDTAKPRIGGSYDSLGDKEAMDAFSLIRNYVPQNADAVTDTIIRSMTGANRRVYIPANFKAVIDLEIDAVIESGTLIQRCLRCNEYFIKDETYPHDYCTRKAADGRTCLEIFNEQEARELANQQARLSQSSASPAGRAVVVSGNNSALYKSDFDIVDSDGVKIYGGDGDASAPQHAASAQAAYGTQPAYTAQPAQPAYAAQAAPILSDELDERCDKLYKIMSERVVELRLSQRDFDDWAGKLSLMRTNLINGDATPDDFASFEEYTLSIDFGVHPRTSATSHSGHTAHSGRIDNTPHEYDERGREIKPFIPSKVPHPPVRTPEPAATAATAATAVNPIQKKIEEMRRKRAAAVSEAASALGAASATEAGTATATAATPVTTATAPPVSAPIRAYRQPRNPGGVAGVIHAPQYSYTPPQAARAAVTIPNGEPEPPRILQNEQELATTPAYAYTAQELAYVNTPTAFHTPAPVNPEPEAVPVPVQRFPQYENLNRAKPVLPDKDIKIYGGDANEDNAVRVYDGHNAARAAHEPPQIELPGMNAADAGAVAQTLSEQQGSRRTLRGELLKNPYLTSILNAPDEVKLNTDNNPGAVMGAGSAPGAVSALGAASALTADLAEEAESDTFADVLSSFDRKDGFGDAEGDGAGSHKTERLMKALFGSSTPLVSPLLNPDARRQ